MANGGYVGDGSISSIYARRIGSELVVNIGMPGRASTEHPVVIEPVALRRPAAEFINELVDYLLQHGGNNAIIPPLGISQNYAGSGRFGFVLAIHPEYEKQLKGAIKKLNVPAEVLE
ncbi:hypothetical protein HYX05_00320 [Candidatus Woesearchaeota archaeon]|nr:hypothetical protein [Candidatus Woesearchaeota archaeon]